MLLGVDVSHHQEPARIDWARFAQSGVRFAYVRATYGVSEDASFLQHMENARLAGILTGAYHFLRYKASQPAAAQAEAFLDALEPLAPHANTFLPPMLDLEDNSFDDAIRTATDRRTFVAMANGWLQVVEQRLGRLAGIYTRANFFDATLAAPPGFGARPLWVAHYTTRPAPTLPQSWARHTFWQYTENGHVAGFDKPLDLNRFDGTDAQLLALAGATAITEDTDPDPQTEGRTIPLGTGGAQVMRVAGKGLNLRSARKVSDQTFMVALPLGHRVEVVQANLSENGITWAHVRTFVTGVEQLGYVAQSHLRALERPNVEALVDVAVAQWKRFKMGAGTETLQPYAGFVGEMWRDLIPGSPLTGMDTNMFWSAAAISYFVHHAGPDYAAFKRSAQHSTYIHDAIVKREAGAAAPFWGYRLHEKPVAVGDILCIDRTASGITYDFARTHASFSSHTDVIVGIQNRTALTLGGNVADSVATKEVPLAADGKVMPGNRLFAVMKNMTP